MAVGDSSGNVVPPLPQVPDTGEEGKVKYGAREINKTRDMVADVMLGLPVGKAGYRAAAGISSGIAAPTGGADGDIYFKTLL
jgi:hypothetical protein